MLMMIIVDKSIRVWSKPSLVGSSFLQNLQWLQNSSLNVHLFE